MPAFTHLHLHSHYSLLDGLGRLDDILGRVKELGMESVALTDHGVMYGVIEFVQKAREMGIKPIIGVEAYVAPNGHTNKRGKIDTNPRHVTLIAQTTQGYKNLIQLTTIAHLAGYYYRPRIDYELLEKYGEGLVVLSGCLNSDISRAILEKRASDAERLIEWHRERFGRERFFLEVQHHPNLKDQTIVNEALFAYGKKYNLLAVATGDAHYVHSEDAEAQDVLLCVQTGKTVQDKNRLCMLGEDFSIQGPQEMLKMWRDHPEVVEQAAVIADGCNVEIEFGVNRLPRYPGAPDEKLRELAEAGLKQRYGENLPTGARERMNYELDVIKTTGFASYFLIVADFVNEAKRRGILVGPGRGSAAGSLVSYLTNITNIDPLSYNLLFERFLNPQRVSMPDIDLDFADDRRDEVIEYVREKYGREFVAQIITFGTMAARAAVRDAGRALGYPYSFCDMLAKSIPPFTDFEKALKPGTELRVTYEADPQAKRLIDTARKLEGVARHASTHAAGVVIGDRPLTDYVPLQYTTTGENQQTTVTQYAMGSVEALGLLKMDFLGLKNLTIIQEALRLIKARHNVEIDLDKLPLDDAKTYRVLQLGQTTGVFQLESSGMKRYLKELKPTEFEDIISMVALYRPGPMDSIPDFIAAKHGRKQITYLHPLLKPILEKTYGVIVTQDQVLQIAREFAGFSYAEADILRKAVGKKIKALLVEQREKFIAGAVKNKGIVRSTAKKVWDFIEPFARYGFNRAHAACYAMIAYQTAYLKANYPADFMAALMTADEGNTDRQAIEVSEAVGMGLNVLPPDINTSYENFSVADNQTIRFGLAAIKNVGSNAVAAIIAEREQGGAFRDLPDVFRRIPNHDLNKKTVESLAKAGALDTIAERNQTLSNLETLLEFGRSVHKRQDMGQKNLFGAATGILAPVIVRLSPTEAATKQERLRWEKELLGLYVSEHPLSEFQGALNGVVVPLTELAGEPANSAGTRVGTKVRVAGIITRVKKITTKNQQAMAFVQLEDLAGTGEVVVFPSLYAKSTEAWQDGAAVLVEGKINDKDGERKILADNVWKLTHKTLRQFGPANSAGRGQSPRGVVITVPRSFDRKRLAALKEWLAANHTQAGAMTVQLMVPHNGGFKALSTPYRVPGSVNLQQELVKIVGERGLRYT